MKSTFLLLALILAISTGCKTHSQGSGCCSKQQTATVTGATTGKVSHQFQATGCGTVIVVDNAGNNDPQILIPKDKLAKEFDKDGLVIKFNFRLLKMPNPAGCATGNIAEITDISK